MICPRNPVKGYSTQDSRAIVISQPTAFGTPTWARACMAWLGLAKV